MQQERRSSQNQEKSVFYHSEEENQGLKLHNSNFFNFFFDNQKPTSKSLRLTQIPQQISDKQNQKLHHQQYLSVLIKTNKTIVTSNLFKISKSRLTNYVFPNIIREVKRCLLNSFQGQNKHLYEILWEFYQKLGIKYQIWAFDAILMSLIYLRDCTKLLTHKRYYAIIDSILSTLSKFQTKFTNKPLNLDQLQFLRSQYAHCLNHTKLYDNENNSFSILHFNGGHLKLQFFQNIILKRRKLLQRFVEAVHKVGSLLNSGILDNIMNKTKN